MCHFKCENVLKACEASVKRSGGRPIDLYQIYFPNAYANAEYWEGMALAYERGLIKAVGVSNYGVDAHELVMQHCSNTAFRSLAIKFNILCCKDILKKMVSYKPVVILELRLFPILHWHLVC